MNFLQKAAEAVNKNLTPEMKAKISGFAEKAGAEASKLKDTAKKHIPEDVQKKMNEAAAKAKALGAKAEKEIYEKYVPEDVRQKIKDGASEVKKATVEAKDVFKEDMSQKPAKSSEKAGEETSDKED